MNKLKELREAKNLNQLELGNLLNITQSAVAHWEAGHAMPRADVLPELAKILGCTIDELFSPSEEATS